MQRICFATNNSNKIKEISSQLNGQFEVISLADLECTIDLPENQATLKGNAEEKATYIWEHYKTPCFADDTGLEIEALNGEPGVYSARYAGDARDNEANISLVLQNLKTATNRRAQFTTVICHIDSQGKKHFFEGVAKGTIRTERSGKEGFGYDPIFEPIGYTKTFAEISLGEKNSISHRGKAVKQLIRFLLD